MVNDEQEASADEVLRQYLVAGDSRDFTKLEGLLATGLITHSPGDVKTVGLDSQIAAWTAAHQGLDDLRHEILGVVREGETAAAARVRVSGTHNGPFLGIEPTGAQIEVDQALFVRVAGGRIAEIWEVVDTGSGLRQLGVLGDQTLSPGA